MDSRTGAETADNNHGIGPAWGTLISARVQRGKAELSAVTSTTPALEQELRNAKDLLAKAEATSRQPGGFRQWWRGDRQFYAAMCLFEGEALLALTLQGEELAAHARDALALADKVMPPGDRRVAVVERSLKAQSDTLPVTVAHLIRAVHDVEEEKYAQSRGFRNRLIRLSGLAVGALIGLEIAIALGGVPLAITDRPAPPHIAVGLLLALFGAIGALIVSVPPLARTGGTWNPFSLPWYQMAFKVALGPVLAVVGVLLLQSGTVPNVSVPMPLSDLLVWALAFGAGQQAVTSVIDRRISGLLADGPVAVTPVRRAPRAGDEAQRAE